MREHKRARHYKVLIILLLLLPALFLISLNAGYTDISISDMMRIIFGGGTSKENLILFQFRLPRILISILVGIGFSLSGCILQGITRNPLADPGLMGINAGAGIVVVTFMTLQGTLSVGTTFALPIFSLLGAAISGGLIYVLSTKKSYGISPMRLVLNGVAIQAGINALMTILVIKLDPDQFDFLASWQSGSIWNSNWNLVKSLVPWIVFGYLLLIRKTRKMDVLVLGDEVSKGLGVEVKKEKRALLFVAVSLAASCVAVSGSINFAGLIAPHLSRKLVGTRHRWLLPTCALIGAILVLLADTVARTIIEPSEIPTGIVVSIIGAPYFVFLLFRSRKASAFR